MVTATFHKGKMKFKLGRSYYSPGVSIQNLQHLKHNEEIKGYLGIPPSGSTVKERTAMFFPDSDFLKGKAKRFKLTR